jgi:hypothetical protein
VLLAAAVLVAGTAWGAPCRKAVVVYLDVSGSMFEERHRVDSPGDGQGPVLLIEAMVDFLHNALAGSPDGVLNPGDSLEVRGFSSQVGPLFGPLDSFSRERHGPELAAMDGRLDINGNGRLDFDDYKNPAFLARRADGSLLGRTDFTAVLRDMLRKHETLQVGPRASYSQLVFLLLTDAGHDAGPPGDFRSALEQAAQALGQDVEEGRLTVVFASLGYAKPGSGDYDVLADFEQAFQALTRSVELGGVDYRVLQEQIRTRLRRNVRLERVEVSVESVINTDDQIPLPRTMDPGQGPTQVALSLPMGSWDTGLYQLSAAPETVELGTAELATVPLQIRTDPRKYYAIAFVGILALVGVAAIFLTPNSTRRR